MVQGSFMYDAPAGGGPPQFIQDVQAQVVGSQNSFLYDSPGNKIGYTHSGQQFYYYQNGVYDIRGKRIGDQPGQFVVGDQSDQGDGRGRGRKRNWQLAARAHGSASLCAKWGVVPG
jgi:hypothetical protein